MRPLPSVERDHISKTLTLTGLQPSHTYYYSMASFGITDSSGSGDGWEITIQASPIKCVSSCTGTPGTLPSGSLSIMPPKPACGPQILCTGRSAKPTVNITGITPIDVFMAPIVLTACSITCAGGPTAMGNYKITPGNFTQGSTVLGQLRLITPATITPGSTYTTKIVITFGGPPTAVRVSRIRAWRDGRHILIRWRCVWSPAVTGFTLSAGTHDAVGRVILPHRSPWYQVTLTSRPNPYALRVMLRDGEVVPVAVVG
jgi:hypothetical protein